MAGGSVNVHQLAVMVAGHSERLQHLEDAVDPVQQHGNVLASQAEALRAIAERMGRMEDKITSLRNWLLGVLTTSVGSLLLLLWQTVEK